MHTLENALCRMRSTSECSARTKEQLEHGHRRTRHKRRALSRRYKTAHDQQTNNTQTIGSRHFSGNSADSHRFSNPRSTVLGVSHPSFITHPALFGPSARRWARQKSAGKNFTSPPMITTLTVMMRMKHEDDDAPGAAQRAQARRVIHLLVDCYHECLTQPDPSLYGKEGSREEQSKVEC